MPALYRIDRSCSGRHPKPCRKAAIHGSAKIKLIGIAIDAPKDRLTNSENFVLLDTETGQTSSDKHLRS